MPLTIPDLQAAPTFDAQAERDSTDDAALAAGEVGTGVVSGCGVTPHTGSDMNVSVAAGTVVVNGISVAVSAVTSTAIAAAGTYDRRDIVTVNSSGTVSVTTGTQCGTAGWSRTSGGLPPVKPAIPSNSVLLAEVYVAQATTAIATGNIVDKTTIVLAGNYAGGTLGSNVSISATTATKIFDTASLGIGTWLLDFQCLVLGSTGTNADGWVGYVEADSASCTFVGPTSTEQVKGLASAWVELNLCTIAVVTAAGTISFNVYGAVTGTAEVNDYHSAGSATGYTAVRIA